VAQKLQLSMARRRFAKECLEKSRYRI